QFDWPSRTETLPRLANARDSPSRCVQSRGGSCTRDGSAGDVASMWRASCLGVCCLLSLCAHPGLAAGPTLAEARQRWLHGNYAEARALYEKLAKEAAGRDPKGSEFTVATVGLSRSLQSTGDYDQALQVIDRSEEHTSELQSLAYLVCPLLLEKKKNIQNI